MRDDEDAFGHLIHDHYLGKHVVEVVEREDGYFDTTGGPGIYFTSYEEWPARQRKAMEFVKGRVMDIGCGAGRHSLHLQKMGFEVLGVDISPLAVETARLRGPKNAEVLGITQLSRRLGTFDTIIMLGHNFGLLGSRKRARWLLRRFRGFTAPGACIVAETRDPLQTGNPFHLEYHEMNRKRGRMPGQVRLRVRYQRYASHWMDYLMASRGELEELLEGTGWAVDALIDEGNPSYVAVIGKRVR